MNSPKRKRIQVRLAPPDGGHPHQSKIGSEEPIFDSFSLEGEAFGGRVHISR